MRNRFSFGLLAVLMAFGLGLTLGACNTVAGAGEDISAGGQAIEGAAEKTQNAL